MLNTQALLTSEKATQLAPARGVAFRSSALGETLYWLELLRDVDLIPDNDAYRTIYADCEELIRLLVASLKKLKPVETKPEDL